MNINVLFYILLAFSLSCTILIAWLHHRVALSGSGIESIKLERAQIKSIQSERVQIKETAAEESTAAGIQLQKESKSTKNPEARLFCEKYGGPDKEASQPMVYWSDIPRDAKFISPYKKTDTTQYLIFEPDGGGWNNIRRVEYDF